MLYKSFLEGILNLSSNPNKPVDSTALLKLFPKSNKDELYNTAIDLRDQGMIKMQEFGKDFQASLTPEGKSYLDLLKIF